MLKAEFLLQLTDGTLISYDEILSPFKIYRISTHLDTYLFIPREDQNNIRGKIIIANENGIRICGQHKWTKPLVAKIYAIMNCKMNNIIKEVDTIPMSIQDEICQKLIKLIKYN